MADQTPAEELRAAAARLREPVGDELLVGLLDAREPLAALLDDAVDRLGYFAGLGEKALSLAEYELAVARALLGGGRD